MLILWKTLTQHNRQSVAGSNKQLGGTGKIFSLLKEVQNTTIQSFFTPSWHRSVVDKIVEAFPKDVRVFVGLMRPAHARFVPTKPEHKATSSNHARAKEVFCVWALYLVQRNKLDFSGQSCLATVKMACCEWSLR